MPVPITMERLTKRFGEKTVLDGIDLRIRSNMVASQIDNNDPYRPATPERLASDLAKARELLVAVRQWCAP